MEKNNTYAKEIPFTYKGYNVIIHRSKRRDCSLSINKIKVLNSYERPNILIAGNNLFLTIRSAKRKAIEIVNYFSQFD